MKILQDRNKIAPIGLMKDNDFSAKLSNLPRNITKAELGKKLNNLNIKSFYIPKSRKRRIHLQYAFINFWNEADLNFASKVEIKLRNQRLIWLDKNHKTCHKCGSADHLVKQCDTTHIKIVKNKKMFNLKIGNKQQNVAENQILTEKMDKMEKHIDKLWKSNKRYQRTIKFLSQRIDKHFTELSESLKNNWANVSSSKINKQVSDEKLSHKSEPLENSPLINIEVNTTDKSCLLEEVCNLEISKEVELPTEVSKEISFNDFKFSVPVFSQKGVDNNKPHAVEAQPSSSSTTSPKKERVFKYKGFKFSDDEDSSDEDDNINVHEFGKPIDLENLSDSNWSDDDKEEEQPYDAEMDEELNEHLLKNVGPARFYRFLENAGSWYNDNIIKVLESGDNREIYMFKCKLQLAKELSEGSYNDPFEGFDPGEFYYLKEEHPEIFEPDEEDLF